MGNLATATKRTKSKSKGVVKASKSTRAASKTQEPQQDFSRDALIEKYLPYATSIAAKVVRTLSTDIDFDDVLCNARLGLLEAAERFDPTHKVDFKTFAYYRIRGAIYDGLRKTGWLPRSLYSKIKFEKAANDYLETQNSGSSAEFLERELKDVKESMNALAGVYVMSVDAAEDLELQDKTADKEIEQKAEFHRVKNMICNFIESLPDKERKLIKMYYFRGMTLEEAGEALGLSKSWTSRLHARSLELLFKKMSQRNSDMPEDL